MATRIPNGAEERLANGLGWFSIGLGLAEVIAPERVANLIGVRKNNGTTKVLRAFGIREMASGVGILARPRPAGWVWSRVAGDVMDLSFLTKSLTSRRTNKTRVATAAAAVLGVTALDVLCGQRLTEKQNFMMRVAKSILVNRSQEEVYRFWRDFRNLARFMNHLASVEVIDERRSHWVAKGPAGMKIEWDAEVVRDLPNQVIAWRSVAGSEMNSSGSVHFERGPGGRGTLLRVEVRYEPPGGALSAWMQKLFGQAPADRIERDLRAFKQLIETGEIVQSDASIHSGMYPAQPPGTPEESLMAS